MRKTDEYVIEYACDDACVKGAHVKPVRKCSPGEGGGGLLTTTPACTILYFREGTCNLCLRSPNSSVQRHYYRVGSHLIFQTGQNETFQSVPELSGTYRSSLDVKSISSMTSEEFSEVY